jgi:hypothetical protein
LRYSVESAGFDAKLIKGRISSPKIMNGADASIPQELQPLIKGISEMEATGPLMGRELHWLERLMQAVPMKVQAY